MEPTRIDEAEWLKKEATLPIRQAIVKKVNECNFLFYQDLLNSIVSWIAVALYIYYTENIVTLVERDWFMYFQRIVHSYFLMDFAFRLLCSKYPRRLLGEFCSWIEMLTTVPFFLVWAAGLGDINSAYFRASIMLVTSRVFLTKRVIHHMAADNTADILNICNILLLIIFFPAAFCSFVETLDTYPEFSDVDTFYEMVYFVFISMTFIGYGTQVYSDAGKLFITVFLITDFVVLPQQAGRLMQLFAAKSPWARARFEKIGKDVPHLVIMGNIGSSNLKNFLDEFFHEDHEGAKKQCVVV